MNHRINDLINTPGEHKLMLDGLAGQIESVLFVPESVKPNHLVLLGHPHSLQGGSMNNKVVTTMVRAARDSGLASLRFNFRGVGLSEGVYDNGIGESNDLLHLIEPISQDCQLIFAGFSFGSYVTYRAAAKCRHLLLVSIAPPVERYDYDAFSPPPSPWEIIMGNADEVASFDAAETFAQTHYPPLILHPFPDTGHFFHGKLIELRAILTTLFSDTIAS